MGHYVSKMNIKTIPRTPVSGKNPENYSNFVYNARFHMGYYIAESSFLPKPERGTFACEDIQQDTNIGLAIQFKNRYLRPDLEWTRTDLCKYTNHSDYPNLDQHIVRSETETFVFFYALRDIKKGDELTINYKDFPYKQVIDLTFLDPRNKMHFLYLTIPLDDYEDFQKNGWSSPLKMYEEGEEDIFHSRFTHKYHEPAADYLGLDPETITDADVMTYIMDSNKPEYWLTPHTIFFNLLSIRWFPDKYLTTLGPVVEVSLDYLKLLCYTPILMDPTEFAPKTIKWETLMRNDILDDVRQSALLCSDLGKKLCMPKIALTELYHINSDLFELTVYEHGIS